MLCQHISKVAQNVEERHETLVIKDAIAQGMKQKQVTSENQEVTRAILP